MTDKGLESIEEPLPPASLMFMGEDHATMFRNGAYLLKFPKEVGIYDSGSPVLDIGCGYGRLAYALRREGHRGAYFGMDILPKHVGWLKLNLLPFLPSGSDFLHLDVQNGRYNPTGKISSADLNFPELRIKPKVAFMFSVFTHMYAEDITRYLLELHRILDKGSYICVTFFLANDEMRELERQKRSQFPLVFRQSEVSWFFSQKDPLHAIGYDERWVRDLIGEIGFEIEHCAYGSWCGREVTKTYQDTIIARKL